MMQRGGHGVASFDEDGTVLNAVIIHGQSTKGGTTGSILLYQLMKLRPHE